MDTPGPWSGAALPSSHRTIPRVYERSLVPIRLGQLEVQRRRRRAARALDAQVLVGPRGRGRDEVRRDVAAERLERLKLLELRLARVLGLPLGELRLLALAAHQLVVPLLLVGQRHLRALLRVAQLLHVLVVVQLALLLLLHRLDGELVPRRRLLELLARRVGLEAQL